MGIKILKLVAACSLLIFLSSCGGSDGGGSTPAAAADNSLTVFSINEQATLKNVAKTVSLFATDSSYTQALSFTATSSSASVVAGIVDSTLTLTPATGFTGTPTITVKAFDGTLYSAAQTFTFTVCNSACAPVLNIVNNDATTMNTAKNITLAGTDANSDSLTYSATSSTSNVVPSISGTTLTLTPATNWTGTATITAKASDAALDSNVKTFTFKVCNGTCIPTLSSVSNQTTTEDTAKVLTLVGNDVQGDALTYTATSSTTNVTTTISGSTLTLNPKLNWSGSATITANTSDGDGLLATQTFTLTTSAVNDAPVVGTVANQTTNEDTAKAVTLSETDVDTGDSHTFSATSSASQITIGVSGTTLTMTPDANWNGTSTITIKANDGTVDSATKTFTLTVSAVNDAPVVGTVANQSTGEDNAKIVTLSETDVDAGDSHTFIATSSTSNVTPSISGATLTLTPATNWSGTATITIKANDGTVDSAAKTFTLTVSGTNDTPVLGSISNQTTNEDTAKAVTLSGTDVDPGDSLTYSATSSASQITIGVSGTTLTMTPDANWNGTSIITAKVNDGTVDSATQQFTLTVSAVNDAPVVGTVANQTTNEDTAKAVTLSETDVDTGDSHTFSATSSASQITIGVSGTTLTMTPDANWNGTSTITIKANDGTVDSATKTFTLTVSAVNDAPTLASISTKTTNQSVKSTLTVAPSDIDGDSPTYSYTLTSSPANQVTGSVSGTTLTLAPIAAYNGTATLTLTVSDGALTGNTSFNYVVTANDPLYQYQWHLDNTGQSNFSGNTGTSAADINVDGVIIAGYDGSGVVVGVVDSGLDIDHPDISPNIVSDGSWDFRDSDNDPTQNGTNGDHGTSVGGLIFAAGWNGKGGRGVSPAASAKGFNFLEAQGNTNWVSAHGGFTRSANVDIFNMSYGSSAYSDSVFSTTRENQYISAVANLRSNKGAIFVKSAGNSHHQVGGNYCSHSSIWNGDVKTSCQNAGADGQNSSPYNIVVGALTATGVKSSYSSAGSAVWVSAPGGEYGSTYPALMTTDDGGCSRGYVHDNTSSSNGFNNSSGGNPHSLNADCNYTATFNGTSSAAPVTSGVIALMLDANPALTWRDVKHILATTSTQVDASKANLTHTIDGASYVTEPAWLTNGAGHKFHNWYGFGRVDAGAAVTAALAYSAGSLGTQNITSWQSSGTVNGTIPNNDKDGVTNVMAVSASEVIEAVQLKMNVTHTFTGCMGVELVSPAGTKSVLAHPYNIFWNTDDWDNYVLLTNAFYGESTNGNWTVRVLDGCGTGSPFGSRSSKLEDWSIRFFEH